MLPLVHTQEELEDLACRYGFLPFFSGPVKGFSIYESTPPSLWFVDIVDALAAAGGVMLSRELKEACVKPKGFDTSITRLQMQTHVTAADFTYMKDKNGNPYGWGIAVFATAEQHFGAEAVTAEYKTPPQESRRRIVAHLQKTLPDVPERLILKLVG